MQVERTIRIRNPKTIKSAWQEYCASKSFQDLAIPNLGIEILKRIIIQLHRTATTDISSDSDWKDNFENVHNAWNAVLSDIEESDALWSIQMHLVPILSVLIPNIDEMSDVALVILSAAAGS